MYSKKINKKICVVGGGRWGQNHIRTLFEMGNLGGIVESNEQSLKQLTLKYPVKGFSSINDAFSDEFAGFVVATPAETHYNISREIIERGNNVLIEKPLTLSLDDSKKIVELAEKKSIKLMVGHLLLFHPAIRKIKELVDSGKVGQLYYLYSTRLNFGIVRTEENVFWSFASHDISVLDYIIGKPSIEIQAAGGKYLQAGIEDFVMTQLLYPDNIRAHIFVSWLHPFKEQRLVVVGSEGMISFSDSTKDKLICFHNKRIDFENGIPRKIEGADEIIDYAESQPLQNELQYFIDSLDNKDNKIKIAGSMSGLEVVRVLEKVQELLK